MKARSSILITGALCGVLACGDSPPGPGTSGRPGTLQGPDVMLTAVTEDVYTVGAYMGEDWESFGSIADVAFDGAGNAHILDRQEDRIVVLGTDGTFVHFVGGSGEGPGELQSPSSLHAYRDGGYVVGSVRRIDFFGSDGTHLRRMPVSPFTGVPFLRSKAFPDGSLVSTVLRADTARWRQGLPQLDPPGRPIEIFSIEHGTPEVLYTAWELPDPEDERRNSRRSSADGVSRLSAGRAFEPRLHFDVISDGRLAVVDSIGYRVKLVARDGSVLGAVERPIAPTTVTEAMKEAARDRYRAREVPSNAYIEPDEVGIPTVRVIRMASLQPVGM